MGKPLQLYVVLTRLDGAPHVFGSGDQFFIPPDLVKLVWAGRGQAGGRALVVEITQEKLEPYLAHLGTIDPTVYQIELGSVKKN